jgi:hypothetical protein
MHKKIVILGTSLLVLASSLSVAGNRPGAVTFTLAEAYYHFAPKRELDNAGMPNIALGYDFTNHWGIEAGVGVLNTSSKHDGPGVHGFLYTLDGLYRFMPYRMFEPYLIGGIGITSLKPNGNEPYQGGNLNAGVGTQIFFDKSVALRVEARDVYTFNGGYNDVMVNFGVSILFGGSQEAPAKDFKGEK